MTKAIWSSRARADFLKHIEWVDSHDPAAAVRLRYKIDERAEWLTDWPYAGAAIGATKSRSFHVLGTNYVIVYRPMDESVVIVRIRHTRQNWRG